MRVHVNGRSYGGVNGATTPDSRVPRGGKMNVLEIKKKKQKKNFMPSTNFKILRETEENMINNSGIF